MSEAASNAPGAKGDAKVTTRIWPWAVAGLLAIGAAFGGVGGWGATVPLASAIIATGQVTVDTNRKQVQHLEGGIVDDLHIRDGDYVKAGAVLIRLDDTRAKASLSISASAYREELAKEARYIAERDEANVISWPELIRDQADDPAIASLIKSQTAIFESRRETLRGEIEILKERIQQLEQEIEGLTARKSASRRQINFIKEELTSLFELLEKGQTTRPRILALQREAARLEGENGEFTANIAKARKGIGETKLEIIQKRKAFRNEVVATLREVQAKIHDLRERHIAAQDVLQRIDIRAPVSGKIVGLNVHAEDAVIKGGETIMELVPSGDRLLFEVKVQPQDIDNVAIGQEAEVRVLAFRQRTTPTLKGTVSYVSADALTNPQDGTTFYTARIRVPESELQRLEGQELQPGMPAEVLIRTGERTALAYMMQPIIDSMNRAWRED